MTKTKIRLALLALAVATVAPLSAQTLVDIRRDHPLFDPSAYGTWHIDPDGDGPASRTHVLAGLMHFEYRTLPSGTWTDTGGLYCVSPFVTLATQWRAWRHEGTDTALTSLTDLSIGTIEARRLAFLANFDLGLNIGNTGHNVAGQNAAAVQLAIWQVVAPSLTFTSNPLTLPFNLNSVTEVLNQSLLYANNPNRPPAGFVLFTDNPSGTVSQHLIGPGGLTPTGEPVPEPFTMALGAAGLALAARMRRKR